MKTLEEYLTNNYSKTSIRSYQNMINRYQLFQGEKVEKATYQEIINYIGFLREQKLHPKSLRNNLLAIKIYYRYLVAKGKRRDHPCQHLVLKDQINRQIQVESLYPKEILEELYQNYKSKTPEHQARNKIIISLLIYQGLTVLEISQIKLKEVNLEEGTIKIKGNIKNKGRKLRLKPNQILLLQNYKKRHWKNYHTKQELGNRKDYFLLSNEGLQLWQGGINRMINKGKSKQNRLTPLKIRQSVIAQLLREKNDLRIVQEFAGHRRATSTEAYKQTGLEELKSAIERLHPLQ